MDQLGFNELVDTAADILETAEVVTDTLKDGFQFTDLGGLLLAAPKIQEVAKDGRQAVNELLDLTPEEAEAAAEAIAQRTGRPATGIIGKVNEAFTLCARTYRQYDNVKKLALDWGRFAKTLKSVA